MLSVLAALCGFVYLKGLGMDWKIFASTFITIFLAEMGDKTQFAALAASSQTKSTMTVIIAVVLALGLAGILGVIFGKFLGTLLSPQIMKYVSGTLFILVGIWVLTAKG
ncbi:TMEM165/GDT1 family protein [Bdellovibrio sp. HCB117]|uniref:TMEM165/GDT1 family protein n=1 Tax=Bdellovibrio sp. HCB117 TaxID=3394359 RepID=UPI0039B3FE6B